MLKTMCYLDRDELLVEKKGHKAYEDTIAFTYTNTYMSTLTPHWKT